MSITITSAKNFGTSIVVTWNALGGSPTYSVSLSPTGGTSTITTTGTTATFTGFTKGLQYTVTVTSGANSGSMLLDDPNYGMCLWLDVADSSTLAFSGTRAIGASTNARIVTSISDKSGQGKNATLTAGFDYPVYVPSVDLAVANSFDYLAYAPTNDTTYQVQAAYPYPALLFRGISNPDAPGTPDSLNATIAQPASGTPFAMFAVMKSLAAQSFWGSGDDGDTLVNYAYWYNVTAFHGAVVIDQRINANLMPNYNFVLQGVYNSSSGGTKYITTKINGTTTGSNTVGSYYHVNNWRICGRQNWSATGYFSEVIIYNRLLTDNEVSMIEGYLATKYGMRSLLPVGHAYYSSPYPDLFATSAGISGGGPLTTVISPYIRSMKNESNNGHTMMLKELTGEAFGVGANDFGQLGVGNTTASTSPIKANVPKRLAQVATGEKTTLFLASDGTVYATGRNSNGECGLGNTSSPITTPTQLVGLTGKIATDVAAGTTHGAVVCSDGSLYTFGSNTFGQLGRIGSGTSTPTLVTLANSKLAYSVVCVRNTTIVLCTDGTLQGFGLNSSSQIGDGTTTNRSTPVVINTSSNKPVAALFGGNNFCAALCQDNSIQTWGLNADGATGTGQYSSSRVSVPYPILMPSGKTVANIALSNKTGYIVFTDGTVFGFGFQNNSALAGLAGTYITTPSLLTLSVGGKTIKNVTTTIDSCFAIVNDGTVYVWGLNTSGSFGTGSTSPSTSATPVLTLFSGISTSVTPLQTIVNPPSISIRPFVESQQITYYWGMEDPSTISSVSLSCIGPGGGTAVLNSNERFYTFSNLTNGSNYDGAIVGSDSGGIISVSSFYRTVQPGFIASPSQNVVFTKVGESIQVTWDQPATPGSEIKWYFLNSTDNSYSFGIEPFKREFTSTSISAGTYTWVLRAVNDAGYGVSVYSSPITF